MLSVGYHRKRGVCLQRAPFSQYQAELSSKTSYQQTQQLGSAMRAAGVELFEYRSARSEPAADCVGLFSAKAFTASQPDQSSQWLCELSAGQVAFKQNDDTQVYQFNATQFMVDGKLPTPA
nr:RES family NAD+ phosphorylase [Arsukibacterium perlucidum]